MQSNGLSKAGAKYGISPASPWPQHVALPKFDVRLIPHKPFLTVHCKDDIEPDALPRVTFDAAQRSLDLMSVRGGGHHRVTGAWDARVLWLPESDGSHLRISDELPLSLPVGGMTTKSEGAEPSFIDETKKPRYHPALRYFRWGQTAGDVFTAFNFTYLAFENLLSSKVSRLRRPDGRPAERERDWLERALEIVVQDYGDPSAMEIGSPGARRHFVDFVYRDVRCNLFHAKEGETPRFPDSPEEGDVVNAAMRILVQHVLELSRDAMAWAPHARPLMDYDMLPSGQWLAGNPTIRLTHVETPIEPGGRTLNVNERLSRPAMPVFTGSWEPEFVSGNALVDGFSIRFNGGVRGSARLGLAFPLERIRRVTVDLAVTVPLTQLIRTSFPDRSSD